MELILFVFFLIINKGLNIKNFQFLKSNLTNDNINTLIDAINNYNIQIQHFNFSNNGLNDKCLSNNSFSIKMKEKIQSYSSNNDMDSVKIFI